MKDTRTGVAKGTFWAFYCAAQATAYTTNNIKSSWRATGTVPFNPGTVVTRLTGYKPPRAVPGVLTTPRSFKLLQTPANRRGPRQQTPSAIGYPNADPTPSGAAKEPSITLLRRLAHQSKSALMRCLIAGIEASDVRQKCTGKHAPRANRTKLSETRVVDNMEVVRPQMEAAKEEAKARKAQAKAARAQAKATRHGTGRVGGVDDLLRQRYGLRTDHNLSLASRPAAVGDHCRF